MSRRLTYLFKYIVPALLILLTTFELVQVALNSLYVEKQHKLSDMSVILAHQIQAAHISFDNAQRSPEQMGQQLQPILDSLFFDGNDVDGTIYLPQVQQFVAFAPRSIHQNNAKSNNAKAPIPANILQVLETGRADFYSNNSAWRAEPIYHYLYPYQQGGKTVAIFCISQPLATFKQQIESIYLSGVTISLLALMFLIVLGFGEFKRSQNLHHEQDKLVQWLKRLSGDPDPLTPLVSNLTLLKQLPTEFINALQLVQSERKQKLGMLNELPLGIITFDHQERIIYVNPSFSRLIGYAPEEILTWSMEEWCTRYRMYNGDCLGDLMEREGAIENGRGLLQHRDGSEIPFALTMRSLLDEHNERLGFLLIFTDLSNEFALNRLEQKTHHMFNSIPLSVILIDAEHHIEYVNPAMTRMFGCSEQDLIGRFFYDSLPWDFPATYLNLQEQIEQVLSTGVPNRPAHVRCLLQGRECDLELGFFPITNPYSNETDGCMVLIKDTTLAREWEELTQRVDAHSSYVQMAATIAHEVRNPMTSIRGFLQLLSSHITNDKQRMYLDVMQTEIDRMNAILSEYLSMVRTPQPEWERIVLAELIYETLLVLEGEANFRGISLDLNLHVQGVINGISRELKQVLINIVRNAFDAMEGTHGRIGIELSDLQPGSYQLRITDTGCGISDEQMARIFDPFFTTKAMGTGLGLPVCKKIIETHGGTLTVQSSLGAGTTFLITLPEAVRVDLV